MLLGSEGILGVITQAWMRVRPRPRFRAAADVEFQTFEAGARAVRDLAQSGLDPSNCRLLDPGEAELTGASAAGRAVLVLGFESADHPLDAWLERALELCGDHGGTPSGEPRLRGPDDGAGERGAAEGSWRDAFLRAPYLRDTMVAGGVLAETFETAITWDAFDDFVAAVAQAAESALGEGRVTCRLTHAYPDGAAPYFTVLAPARRGLRAGPVAGGQGRGVGGHRRRGRDDHPPPRGGPRSPPLVRPPAPRRVRVRPAGCQARAGPGRHAQPRRPDRSVSERRS